MAEQFHLPFWLPGMFMGRSPARGLLRPWEAFVWGFRELLRRGSGLSTWASGPGLFETTGVDPFLREP